MAPSLADHADLCEAIAQNQLARKKEFEAHAQRWSNMQSSRGPRLPADLPMEQHSQYLKSYKLHSHLVAELNGAGAGVALRKTWLHESCIDKAKQQAQRGSAAKLWDLQQLLVAIWRNADGTIACAVAVPKKRSAAELSFHTVHEVHKSTEILDCADALEADFFPGCQNGLMIECLPDPRGEVKAFVPLATFIKATQANAELNGVRPPLVEASPADGSAAAAAVLGGVARNQKAKPRTAKRSQKVSAGAADAPGTSKAARTSKAGSTQSGGKASEANKLAAQSKPPIKGTRKVGTASTATALAAADAGNAEAAQAKERAHSAKRARQTGQANSDKAGKRSKRA